MDGEERGRFAVIVHHEIITSLRLIRATTTSGPTTFVGWLENGVASTNHVTSLDPKWAVLLSVALTGHIMLVQTGTRCRAVPQGARTCT